MKKGKDRESRQVNFRRVGQRIDCYPPIDELLKLRTTRTTVSVGEDGRIETHIDPAHMVYPSEMCFGQDFAISPGMEPVARYLVEKSGRTVTSTGTAPAPLEPLSATQRDEATDPHVLEFIRDRDRGLIRYVRGRVDPLYLIAQVALAWPECRVTVLCATDDEVYSSINRLNNIFGELGVSLRIRRADANLVVKVFKSHGDFGAPIGTRDLVFVLDATQANGREARKMLSAASQARLFAFLPFQARMAKYVQDRLVERFGLDEIEVPAHGRTVASVETAYFQAKTPLDLSKCRDAFEVKKAGIWDNAKRNQKLISLAKTARSNDRLRLAGIISGVDARKIPACHFGCIIVENKTHKDLLSELAADNRFLSILTQDELDQLTSLPPILIMATGGANVPDCLMSRLRSNEWSVDCRVAATESTMLIDVVDRCHPMLRRWAESRKSSYIRNGWYPLGSDQKVMKIERFLADRPGDGDLR